MKIKIIKSDPRHGQEGINHLIGQTKEARRLDKEDGSVEVDAPEFAGVIRLNRGEFQRLKKK